MPNPALGALGEALIGKRVGVSTPRGPITYRQGGLVSNLAGRPVTLGSYIASPEPLSPETAIHERQGHAEGKGALSDLLEFLKGNVVTPYLGKGMEAEAEQFWRPSEIYGYTTQPAELSQEDMERFARTLMAQPDLEARYQQYRNPQSDWPSSIEGFKALGIKSQDELNRALLEARGIR